MNITVTDFGGDHEYYVASRIFFVDNGIFMIMFDSSSVTRENLTSNVGNYLDLVLQNSDDSVICLVAAKNDLAMKEVEEFSFVVKWAQNYIKFLVKDEDSKIKVSLYDKVLMTSSKVPEKEWLEDMSELLTSVITNKNLIKSHQEIIPLSWNLFLKELLKNENPELDMSNVEDIFEEVKERAPPLTFAAQSDSVSQVESIKSLQKLLSESEEILWVERIIERGETRKPKGGLKRVNKGEVEKQEVDEPTFKNENDVEKEEGNKDKQEIAIPESNEIIKNEETYGNHLDQVEESYSSGVELVVRFFTDLGDLLRFTKIDSLKHKVFTKPMKLIEDCRLEKYPSFIILVNISFFVQVHRES